MEYQAKKDFPTSLCYFYEKFKLDDISYGKVSCYKSLSILSHFLFFRKGRVRGSII